MNKVAQGVDRSNREKVKNNQYQLMYLEKLSSLYATLSDHSRNELYSNFILIDEATAY